MITRAHTKTFALMDAWASTIPHDRRDCEDPCPKPHVHAWDVCAAPQCNEHLLLNEVCYSVLQVQSPDTERGELWVCWRHVRPDEGPIRVPRDP
jgi:hypothetical protein